MRKTRVSSYGEDTVRKRVRECLDCGYRFLTFECYEIQIHDDAEDVIKETREELMVVSDKLGHILTELNRKG